MRPPRGARRPVLPAGRALAPKGRSRSGRAGGRPLPLPRWWRLCGTAGGLSGRVCEYVRTSVGRGPHRVTIRNLSELRGVAARDGLAFSTRRGVGLGDSNLTRVSESSSPIGAGLLTVSTFLERQVRRLRLIAEGWRHGPVAVSEAGLRPFLPVRPARPRFPGAARDGLRRACGLDLGRPRADGFSGGAAGGAAERLRAEQSAATTLLESEVG